MRTYVVGQEIKLKGTFRNEEGELANPGTVAFKVIDHAGNETTYSSPTKDSTGIYHQMHTITAAETGGVSEYRAEGTEPLVTANEESYKVRGSRFT